MRRFFLLLALVWMLPLTACGSAVGSLANSPFGWDARAKVAQVCSKATGLEQSNCWWTMNEAERGLRQASADTTGHSRQGECCDAAAPKPTPENTRRRTTITAKDIEKAFPEHNHR